MRIPAFLLALLMAICPFQTASAVERKEVPANRTSSFFGFVSYNPYSCEAGGRPKLIIDRQPAHGRVTSEWRKLTLDSKFGICAGKVRGALVLFYTPTKGFRGQDNVSFTLRFTGDDSGRTSRSTTYRVELLVR